MVVISILILVTVGSNGSGKELVLAIISAYSTHLAIDSFTKEGILTFSKGFELKRWIKGFSKGDSTCWEYWQLF